MKYMVRGMVSGPAPLEVYNILSLWFNGCECHCHASKLNTGKNSKMVIEDRSIICLQILRHIVGH